MSLKSRVLKIEDKVRIKTAPNWMFITVVSENAPDNIMQVTDINHIYPGTCRNEYELPIEEFLPIASEFFGVDMATAWGEEHEYIDWC